MNTTTTDPQFDALVRRLLTLTPEQQRQLVDVLRGHGTISTPDESTQDRLFAEVAQDPEAIKAAASYGATLKALQAMAPELDKLIFELDSCVGRYIVAHLFTGYAVGRREAVS